VNRAEQSLYEILFRNWKEAVIFVDAGHRVRIFNHIAEKYFELQAKAVVGRKLERAIPQKNVRKHFDVVFGKKEVIRNIELAIHFPAASAADREGRLLQCSFYPIFERGGEFLGVFSTFSDVTEKGLLSREISKSRDLSTISVLSRWWPENPTLSSLNINIELLRDELLGESRLTQREEILSLLNFISYETLRLETNLKDFLDFNRLPPPAFESVQINEVVDSVVRLLGPDVQMRNARIETHFQKKMPQVKIDSVSSVWPSPIS
jgi:nitrogen fixation/metabolism regulation signal transduction histidine kinase